MSGLPLRASVAGTPDNATAAAAFGALFDFVAQRLAAGTAGAGAATAPELALARSTLVAAISGENDDLTAAMLMPVGSSRNMRAYLAAVGTSVTFTCDHLIVAESLAGRAKRLDTFSEILNITTTGNGGMDIGAAPATGSIAVYGSAKPDGTPGIFACNATVSSGSVYSGANIPAGYTYTSLIGIWPTNATPALLAGYINENREFSYQTAKAIASNVAGPTTLTLQSISSAVPAAAKSAVITMGSTSASSYAEFIAASDSTGTCVKRQQGATDASLRTQPSGMANSTWTATHKVDLVTAQTIYWMTLGSGGEYLYCLGYSF